MRDDELLPQTPLDVIDALGFDPRDIDEAAESAAAMTPGGTPNVCSWPRQKALASRKTVESVASDEWALVLEIGAPSTADEPLIL